MPKLPKAMQEKQRQKMARVKGTSQSKGSSRAMRRQLQKQGIEDMEQIDAVRVIIECTDKQIVIENPQVIQLKQQGMTVHQVIGEPIEKELSESMVAQSTSDESISDTGSEEELIEEEIKTGIEIKQQDIIIVASQAGVSEEEAKNALEEADGDLARAILNLKTR